MTDEDKDFLGFLWRPDADLTQDIIELRMTVHFFGAFSSPSCACFAPRKTAEDNQHSIDLEVIDTVNKNLYMDDCLKSLPSEEESIQMAKDLPPLFHKGGFHLTQWVSNSREVLQSVPAQD